MNVLNVLTPIYLGLKRISQYTIYVFKLRGFSFFFLLTIITNTTNFKSSEPPLLMVSLLKEKQNTTEAIRQAENKGKLKNDCDYVTSNVSGNLV